MKICYIADAESIHVQRWVTYFASRGHDVHLISLKPFGGGIYKSVSLSLHLVRRFRLPLGIAGRVVDNLSMAAQVTLLLSRMNPDILHAHYATANGLLGALTGFHPFVISVWGSDVMRVQQRSWASRYRTAYALRRADCITTTAMFMKGYLIKTFGLAGDRIVRVPWGIDLQVFHHGYEKEAADLRSSLGIEADAPVVLSNRHMVPLYNIDSIVSSIPCVLKSYPQTVFVLIRGYGTPEFENQMRLKTRKLGVESNVRIVPRAVTPHEMAIYLSMSNVFLSIPKTDQFGSSVMEGMACGSTPIVSNIEAYHQYLKDGENAFIVDAQSPEEIADKIVYCIGHPKIKDSFYAANKKIIEEKEDWSKNAKRMEELYKRLLESK